MTQKSPTLWQANPAKEAGVAYNSSTTTYNSSSAAYSSTDSAEDEFSKTPELWSKVAKTPQAWQANPAANVDLYLYDSATHLYDSVVDTYDGTVTGEDFGDQQTPTSWSKL